MVDSDKADGKTVYFLCMASAFGGAERIGKTIAELVTKRYPSRRIINKKLINDGFRNRNTTHCIAVPQWACKISRNPFAILFYLTKAIKYVATYPPSRGSIFYCNDIESVCFAVILKYACHGEIIWHVHDVFKIRKVSTHLVLKGIGIFVDVIVCLTNANARRLSQTIRCRCETIPNFCRLEPLRSRKKKPFNPHRTIVFGYIGQITKWKRVDLCIQLVRELNETFAVSAKLRIAGRPLFNDDKAYQEQLFACSRDLPYIEWIGQVTDPTSYFADLDFTLSMSENEPFGLAIVESMSQGVPVICTPGDGPSEIVNSECGFMLSAIEENLSLRVSTFLASCDSSSYSKLSIAAIHRVQELYSESLFREKIHNVLDSL